MRNKVKIISSAISAVLVLSSSNIIAATTNTSSAQTEKCYGISKSGLNDCASGANSCAGSATKDAQGDAFLFVPTGLCQKIVGGSLKSVPDTNTKK